MNIRLLARSLAIAMVFSILLLVTGSVGITVFALAMETDVTLGPVYAVSFDNSVSFTVTAGPGLFLSFVVVLALLTLLGSDRWFELRIAHHRITCKVRYSRSHCSC